MSSGRSHSDDSPLHFSIGCDSARWAARLVVTTQPERQQPDDQHGDASQSSDAGGHGDGEPTPSCRSRPASAARRRDQPDQLDHAQIGEPQPGEGQQQRQVAERVLDEDEADQQTEHAEQHGAPGGRPPPLHPGGEAATDFRRGEAAPVAHGPGGRRDDDPVAHDPQGGRVQVRGARRHRALHRVGQPWVGDHAGDVQLDRQAHPDDHRAIRQHDPADPGHGSPTVEAECDRQSGQQRRCRPSRRGRPRPPDPRAPRRGGRRPAA